MASSFSKCTYLGTFRYAGAQGGVAILSELLLVIYVFVLTVMAVINIIKSRGS